MSIAGVYTVALYVFGSISDSASAKLDIILNSADGSGQKTTCGAHVQAMRFGAASCSTLLKLDVGDQLWAVGEQDGEVYALYYPFVSFQAYLLYRSDALM